MRHLLDSERKNTCRCDSSFKIRWLETRISQRTLGLVIFEGKVYSVLIVVVQKITYFLCLFRNVASIFFKYNLLSIQCCKLKFCFYLRKTHWHLLIGAQHTMKSSHGLCWKHRPGNAWPMFSKRKTTNTGLLFLNKGLHGFLFAARMVVQGCMRSKKKKKTVQLVGG